MRNIQGLSLVYTSKRDQLVEFEWDEDIVSSYAAFFLPTNFPKFQFVWNLLPAYLKENLGPRELDVIDFGTGPGTYLLAALNTLDLDKVRRFFAVDKEELMLKQCQRLVEHFFPKAKEKCFYQKEIPKRGDTARLFIFGNACNEMESLKIKEILQKERPEFCLFIEPGTPSVFHQLLEIRKYYQEIGGEIHFPCASLKTCPISKRIEAGEEDWCHQVLRIQHDLSIERLSQLAKIDRRAMPMNAHFYSWPKALTGKIAKVNKARFIRFLGENKHSFNWEVCLASCAEGANSRTTPQELGLVHFEIPKKQLSKAQSKNFKKLSVGLNIQYKILKRIQDNYWRVAIDSLE